MKLLRRRTVKYIFLAALCLTAGMLLCGCGASGSGREGRSDQESEFWEKFAEAVQEKSSGETQSGRENTFLDDLAEAVQADSKAGKLPGGEYASEEDPLGAILEKLKAQVDAYTDENGLSWEAGEIRRYDAQYDVLYGEDIVSARLSYAPIPGLGLHIWVGWRQESRTMAYCNVDLPDDTDGAALLAVIYSDQVAEGMEAAVSACRESEGWEYEPDESLAEKYKYEYPYRYRIRSAGTAALFTSEKASRLYFLGGELQKEGDLLYFLDGPEAVIYGFDYDFYYAAASDPEGGTQDLFLPEELGGRPVTRIRLSLCDGWRTVQRATRMRWFVIPDTCREVDVEFESGDYILPEGVETITFTYHDYVMDNATFDNINMARKIGYTQILSLSRGAEVMLSDELYGREVCISTYWGSDLAALAEKWRRSRWSVSYLDVADGSWEETRKALSGKSREKLAELAADSAEEAEALLAEKSEEELMALLKARWEDMMEDAGETPEEAKELFRTIKAGDYSRYMSEVR